MLHKAFNFYQQFQPYSALFSLFFVFYKNRPIFCQFFVMFNQILRTLDSYIHTSSFLRFVLTVPPFGIPSFFRYMIRSCVAENRIRQHKMRQPKIKFRMHSHSGILRSVFFCLVPFIFCLLVIYLHNLATTNCIPHSTTAREMPSSCWNCRPIACVLPRVFCIFNIFMPLVEQKKFYTLLTDRSTACLQKTRDRSTIYVGRSRSESRVDCFGFHVFVFRKLLGYSRP